MKLTDHGLIFDATKVAGPLRVCSFTDLCPLSSGKILASFRRGSGKDSADGNCVVAESSDNGQSWRVISEGFESTHSGVTGEVRAVEIVELDDGTLMALMNWVDRSAGEKFHSAETDTLLPLKMFTATSKDGGRTWGSYQELKAKNIGTPAITGSILRLPDKGWLFFLEDYEPREEGGPSVHSSHAWLSPDGQSFGEPITITRHPEDAIFYWDQRQARCARTGRIVSMFWTFDRPAEKDLDIHMAWADPDTLTWEKPYSTGIKGQIAMPIPLPDGRLLSFYVDREAPGALRLIASNDDGKTWDHANELVIYDNSGGSQSGAEGHSDYAQSWEDMNVWTFGHPTACLLDDKTLLLAYYAGPNDKCLSAHWARVEV